MREFREIVLFFLEQGGGLNGSFVVDWVLVIILSPFYGNITTDYVIYTCVFYDPLESFCYIAHGFFFTPIKTYLYKDQSPNLLWTLGFFSLIQKLTVDTTVTDVRGRKINASCESLCPCYTISEESSAEYSKIQEEICEELWHSMGSYCSGNLGWHSKSVHAKCSSRGIIDTTLPKCM